MRAVLVVLMLLWCLPLAADFNCTVSGNVQSPDGKNGGIEVSIEADNMWGHSAETIEKFRRENGPLPVITLSTKTTTQEWGAFSVECNVKVGPEGKLPVQRQRQRGGGTIDTPYVCVTVKPVMAGYRADSRDVHISPDGKHGVGTIGLTQLSTVSGTLIRLSDRKPQANLKVKLIWGSQFEGPTRQVAVTTDAAGKFNAAGDNVGPGPMRMELDDDAWAFAGSSAAWRAFGIVAGANDLGTLVIVPGGGVKGRVVHADTRTGLECRIRLRGTEQGSTVQLDLKTQDGTFRAVGLPQGAYVVDVACNQYHQLETFAFTVQAGKEHDFADMPLEPFRTLTVLAFSDDGAGLERYTAGIRYLSGALPLSSAHLGRPGSQPSFNWQEFSAERSTFQGLWSARWVLEVRAPGHAPRTLEVEIPKESSVSINLERGGAIRVSVFDEAGRARQDATVLAINQASPAYKDAQAGTLQANRWSQLPGGVFRSTMQRNGDLTGQLIDALPVGTYLVLTESGIYDPGTGNYVTLRQDNVVVEKGRTVEVALRPVAARLTVKVTESGAPKSGVKVLLVKVTRGSEPTLIKEASSNARGEVVFTDLKPQVATVMTQREYDWMRSLGRLEAITQQARIERLFKTRTVNLSWGVDATMPLDLAESTHTWVTLEVKVTGEAKPVSGGVLALDGETDPMWGALSFSFQFTDGQAKLGPLPRGKYRFTSSIRISNDMVGLDREFEVNAGPEQTIKLEFSFEALTVTVKPPKGVPANSVQVALYPAGAANEKPDPRMGRFDDRGRYGQLDEKGVATFINVSAGEWVIRGVVYANGVVSHAATEAVTVKGNTKATLKFNDNVGSISVRVSGNPAMGPLANTFSTAKVVLRNAKDQPIEVGSDWFLLGCVNMPWTIPSVPVGTWTAIVSAHGLQPVTQKIKIEKDKVAALNVSPLPAAAVHVILSADNDVTRRIQTFTIQYEDANGKPVVLYTPDDHWYTGHIDDKGNLNVIGLNLDANIKKVRVSIEGYEDVLVDIAFEAGKTFVSEQKLKAKAK